MQRNDQKYLKTYKTLEKIGILNHVTADSSDQHFRRGGYNTACILSVYQNMASYRSYKFDKLLNVRLGLQRASYIVGTGVMLICPEKLDGTYGSNKLRLCLAAADLYRLLNAPCETTARISHHFLGCVFLGPSRKPLFIHSDEFIQKQTNTVLNTGRLCRVLRRTYSPKLISINRTPCWKAALILTRLLLK